MTLTLKMVNQFFCMTHCLVIIHHHTKFVFVFKWLSGSGDTERTQLDTHTELQTDGQSDSNMPPPPPFTQGGGITMSVTTKPRSLSPKKSKLPNFSPTHLTVKTLPLETSDYSRCWNWHRQGGCFHRSDTCQKLWFQSSWHCPHTGHRMHLKHVWDGWNCA